MVSTRDEPRGSFLTVAVVGTGTMGAGIAQAALLAGHVVLIHDVNVDATAAGAPGSSAALDRLVEKGRLTAEGRTSALARLEERHELRDVAREADLVIEAVIEDLTLKRSIFRALDMEAHPSVALATNTSSLSVGSIAEGTHHRERVLGPALLQSGAGDAAGRGRRHRRDAARGDPGRRSGSWTGSARRPS